MLRCSSVRCAVAVAVSIPTLIPEMNRATSSPTTAGQTRKRGYLRWMLTRRSLSALDNGRRESRSAPPIMMVEAA